jgi:TPR repeat protein
MLVSGTVLPVQDPLTIINQIKREAEKGPLSREKEDQYTKQLRSLFMKKEHLWEVMMAFQEIGKNIRRQFPEISDEQYKESYFCVGAILAQKDKKLAIDVLIREGKALGVAAQIKLEIIYRYNVEGYESYDSRILEFFKLMALDGMPRGQFEYGQVLLNGWGIEPNIKEGLKYLELASEHLSEANIELATYYFNQNDQIKLEKYLRRAADQDSVKGVYNLAIIEQNKKNYKEAVRLFNRALELDPQYQIARLELGRMYVHGWGIDKDQKKGFALIKEVAEKTDDSEVKAVAYMNLGIFYQHGMGVRKSLNRARRYFEKAQALGSPDAEKYLEGLNDIYEQPKD